MTSFNRRSLLRTGLAVTGAAAPLVAFTGIEAAQGALPGKGTEPAIDGGAGPGAAKEEFSIAGVPTGVQFTGTLSAFQTGRWFTYNWPASWHVIWHAVATSPRPYVIQVDSSWAIERASVEYITYWITIRNLSDAAVNVEARYAILNLG